ncbi:MAG: ribonucleoside triphosphate reductase [Candidatus Aenigmatarchaeota archaeon]
MDEDSNETKITKIIKRDGRIVDFDQNKITEAIWKAAQAVGGKDRSLSEKLSSQVVELLKKQLKPGEIPNVEQVQDLVEKVLVENGHYKTAKAYILYRALHNQIRELVDSYLDEKTWLVRENANTTFSLQALNFHISSQVISQYWLHRIYNKTTPELRDAHINGDIHIHNLGILGPYCVKPKEIVAGDYKPISEYIVGEHCLGKGGRVNILKTFVRNYKGKIVRIKACGLLPLEITPEHPILVAKWKIKNNKPIFESFEWKMAKDIKPKTKIGGDYLIIPKINGWINDNSISLKRFSRKWETTKLKEFPINEKTSWFLGIYVAEGSSTRGEVVISLGKHEKEIAGRIVEIIKGLGISSYINEQGSTLHVHVTSKVLSRAIKEWCGTCAKNKRIPEFILYHSDKDILKNFLNGYILGDGNKQEGRERCGPRIRMATVSKVLSLQLQMLCARLGIFSSICELDKKDSFINSRKIKGGKIYEISFPLNGSQYVKELEDCFLSPVRLTEEIEYEGRVFNLETTDHTYLVNNICVHNCVGWDLQDLLLVGFTGVRGKISSKPAKHFRSALGQIVNFMFTLQGEAAGAQALSNFDTLLAPFIRFDGLDFKSVKQAIQEFMFNMNVPTRVGFQTPFSNITLDLKVPKFMENEPVIIGGKILDVTYGDFQEEMNIFNQALAEVMLEGDAVGRVFTFPIPTINITKDFEWGDGAILKIFETSARYGIPYFANFINSDMNPEDVRSMCCHLRLDKRELKKRGGGLFGANPLTGSIGVVTINMPRIGYLSKDEREFFERLDKMMEISKRILEIKRAWLEKLTEKGLYPYAKFYLRKIKESFGEYWKNHFNTIGLVGMNEACLNFLGCSIGDKDGLAFSERVLDYMRNRLEDFQQETGNIYNLEATPAEGSLAPEEKVLVSQSDPKMVKIGSFIDSYLEKNRDKVQIIGRSEVLKIPPNTIFTYGFNRETQKIKKYPVTALVRHPAESMYEITTYSGRKVRVTGQHSVFTLSEKGTIQEILVKNIKKGVYIAIPKRIEAETIYRELNLVELFKEASFRDKLYGIFPAKFVEELINDPRVKEWSKKNYKFVWRNVKSLWRKGQGIPLKMIYELDIPLRREILKSTKIFYFKTKPINALIQLDEDFGFVIGSLLAEGWLGKKPMFFNTDKKFIEEFSTSLKKALGLTVSIQVNVDRRFKPCYRMVLSEITALLFDRIGLRGKSDEKKIPSIFFLSPPECIAGLLRGFTQGDGFVYKNTEKRDFSLRLYTNSKELAEGLNLLLLRLGILAKIQIDKKSSHNSQKKYNYVLKITGADNLNKYFKIIFKKELSLNNINSGREVVPEVPKLIKQIMQRHKIKPQDIDIHKDCLNRNVRKNRISLQYFRQIIEKLSSLVRDEEIEKLQTIANSDIHWDKIKDIRELSPPKYVYDLEVDVKDEPVNNFLGGEGLVCLHNTSYRLAKIDKQKYPDIIVANEAEVRKGSKPYYTNSSHLPVYFTDDLWEYLRLQDPLQVKYTGGTVVHIWLGEANIPVESVVALVKKICNSFKLPYFTITPTFSICPEDGYIPREAPLCPKCNRKTEVYSRVVGYLRPVEQWNEGKQEEFKQRKTFDKVFQKL